MYLWIVSGVPCGCARQDFLGGFEGGCGQARHIGVGGRCIFARAREVSREIQNREYRLHEYIENAGGGRRESRKEPAGGEAVSLELDREENLLLRTYT
jgi:hypothetical protein